MCPAQHGHKQWQGYFGRTFDIYTRLWKFQQQHRAVLDRCVFSFAGQDVLLILCCLVKKWHTRNFAPADYFHDLSRTIISSVTVKSFMTIMTFESFKTLETSKILHDLSSSPPYCHVKGQLCRNNDQSFDDCRKYGLKRWQIGEIASKIGQLYYHY